MLTIFVLVAYLGYRITLDGRVNCYQDSVSAEIIEGAFLLLGKVHIILRVDGHEDAHGKLSSALMMPYVGRITLFSGFEPVLAIRIRRFAILGYHKLDIHTLCRCLDAK
jgi:hypothetical protein